MRWIKNPKVDIKTNRNDVVKFSYDDYGTEVAD